MAQLIRIPRIGDVIEVQLPTAAANPTQQTGMLRPSFIRMITTATSSMTEAKHRGFAFVTYASAGDAQDAIDNMDMNELRGRVLKVNVARPLKGQMQLTGSHASEFYLAGIASPPHGRLTLPFQQYGNPRSGSNGMLSPWRKAEVCLLSFTGGMD